MSVQKIIRQDDQPFAMIPNSAIRNPKLTANSFRLLAYLLSHQDGYELTYDQIERQTALGRWAINQASDLLVAEGYLRLERPKLANGYFGPKHWILVEPSTVGDSTMERPHMGESTDNIENNLNKKTKLKELYDDLDFQTFWSFYPRRMNKRAAVKAWVAAVKETPAQNIIEGAARFGADPNLPQPQFIPYPATWLNNERWSDGPLPERVRTAEELAVIAREKYEQEREASLRASERRSAEEARIRAEALANPPERCEHDRVKVMCPKCSDFWKPNVATSD
jgi:hypothetical protein